MSDEQRPERKDTDRVPHTPGQQAVFVQLRKAIEERFKEEGLDSTQIGSFGSALVIRAVLNPTGTRDVIRMPVEAASLDAAQIPVLVERFMRTYADGVAHFRQTQSP